MNFKCVVGYENVKWFKEVISTIKCCVDEVRIEITENGLKLGNLNKSHIMFVELDLKPEFFTEFIIDKSIPISYRATIQELYNVLNNHAIQEQFDPNSGELFFIQPRKEDYYWRKLNSGRIYQDYIKNLDKNSFWIDTDDLHRVINRLKVKDTFSLSEDTGSLIIDVTGKSSKQFKISKIKNEEDVPSAPELNGLSEVLISFESYKEAIMDIKNIKLGDRIYFGLNGDKLELLTQSDNGEALIRLDTNKSSDKSFTSCYSLHYVVGAIQKLKECKTELKIEYGKDTPIQFTYPDLDNTGFFKSLVAPRIEGY